MPYAYLSVLSFLCPCVSFPLQPHKCSHSACVFLSRPLEHTHNDLVCILVHSQPLNVPVFLPQDGNLVPEQHRVQPHLGVHQRHETQPVTEGVHAGLSLGEVVGVGPPR